MSHASEFLSSSRGRLLGGIFLVLFLMLSYFAITAAAGVGGLGIFVVAFIQMLVLAAIVAPYVFAVVYLGGEDQPH